MEKNKKEPHINPYLFLLIKALIRHEQNGTLNRDPTITEWQAFRDSGNHEYSPESMVRLMRDTASGSTRLNRRTRDSLCALTNPALGFKTWQDFETKEYQAQAYSIGIDKRFIDLNDEQKKGLRQMAERRARQLLDRLSLATPETETNDEEDKLENNALPRKKRIEFTKRVARRFSLPEAVVRRSAAWTIIERVRSEQSIGTFYEIKQHVSFEEWLHIIYVVAIFRFLYTEYIQGNIEPSALTYDMMAFIQVWHVKIFIPLLPEPEKCYWLFARNPANLSVFYKGYEGMDTVIY